MHHRSTLLHQTQINLGTKRSWVQAALYKPGLTPSFCMIGGLGAARFYPEGIPSDHKWTLNSGALFTRRKYKDPEMKTAIKYIAKAIYHYDRFTWIMANILHVLLVGYFFGVYPRRARIVTCFNDSSDTTFEDVHKVLSLAQEYAMKDEKKEIAKALAKTSAEETIIERQLVEQADKERVLVSTKED